MEMAELFALDPEHHTTETLDALIGKLRGMRGQFATENNKKAGIVKPRASAAKPNKLAGLGIQLDLGVLKK